ncbi:hypothetical protein LTR10_013024 [Elasticomyces elasticus]|nr:hypothetical protein LTR10_013024 [Elasticomyces elasticus]KAK4978554.1 hypothetical protein LTR42_001054 [Elasticomyces elasticus]
MRLLNIWTLQFRDFGDDELPPYAIASHRWESSESTYKDVQQQRHVTKPGFLKIKGFCELVKRLNPLTSTSQALGDLGMRWRCDWLWIDTVCINKKDGAELSEAINSMFRWYGGAAVCYAYPSDVTWSESTTLDLMHSQWHGRGWTLQELIGAHVYPLVLELQVLILSTAPRTVVFLAENWMVLGHKCPHGDQVCASVCSGYGRNINKLLATATGIPLRVFSFSSCDQLRSVSVEEKLSWTIQRVTTRLEDNAYCLFGLLDLFIPPIYGEGGHAWTRLMQALEYKHNLSVSRQAGSTSYHCAHPVDTTYPAAIRECLRRV